MSDSKNTRRHFLRLMGVAPIALVACGSDVGAGTRETLDSGFDTGRHDAGARPMDAGSDAGVTDAGVTDAGATDAGVTDGGADECELTGSDVEGPFHIEGAPQRTVLADTDEPGERLYIMGTVYGPDCRTPVANAMLDVWHADMNGDYHDGADYRLRGQMMTDAQGRFAFETIKPGRYPLGGSTRPAHIHFMVSNPGFQPLTTQLYFSGDPFLSPNDPCGRGCNSGDATLIIDLETIDEPAGLMGTFDIVLGN
jgi:catechol 1,2-dioxygenase